MHYLKSGEKNFIFLKMVYTLLQVNFLNEDDHFTGKCLKDGPRGDRILGENFKTFEGTLTSEICLDYCKNFKFAGLFYKTYCFCGNTLNQIEPSPVRVPNRRS